MFCDTTRKKIVPVSDQKYQKANILEVGNYSNFCFLQLWDSKSPFFKRLKKNKTDFRPVWGSFINFSMNENLMK